MSTAVAPPPTDAEITIDLRDRNLAALLAWLIPGAGHMYQRRWGKGFLYSVCVLSTFFFGMYLGGGKVVYAYWGKNSEQRRLYYFLQIPAGLPALPALVQANFPPHKRPFGEHFMAPPRYPAPGANFQDEDGQIYKDELSKWHLVYGDGFEMGTVYTVIAGLLNILIIYDAWAGPVAAVPDNRKRGPPQGKNEKDK